MQGGGRVLNTVCAVEPGGSPPDWVREVSREGVWAPFSFATKGDKRLWVEIEGRGGGRGGEGCLGRPVKQFKNKKADKTNQHPNPQHYIGRIKHTQGKYVTQKKCYI